MIPSFVSQRRNRHNTRAKITCPLRVELLDKLEDLRHVGTNSNTAQKLCSQMAHTTVFLGSFFPEPGPTSTLASVAVLYFAKKSDTNMPAKPKGQFGKLRPN